MPGPGKRLTPINSGSNTKFRYLNRGAVLPRQPSGQPGIHWSSCAIGAGKKGIPGGVKKVQYAFGFTQKGTQLIERSEGLILGGAAATLTGYAAPVGLFFIAWGVIQNLYAHTEYVKFERPCSDKPKGKGTF